MEGVGSVLMKQRTVRTPKRRGAFLTALAAGHSVVTACQLSRLGRTAVYAWRDDDPAFAAEWRDAAEAGIDLLEDEARRRAMAGSDLLLIFLLRNRRPDVFEYPDMGLITGKERLVAVLPSPQHS